MAKKSKNKATSKASKQPTPAPGATTPDNNDPAGQIPPLNPPGSLRNEGGDQGEQPQVTPQAEKPQGPPLGLLKENDDPDVVAIFRCPKGHKTKGSPLAQKVECRVCSAKAKIYKTFDKPKKVQDPSAERPAIFRCPDGHEVKGDKNLTQILCEKCPANDRKQAKLYAVFTEKGLVKVN